MICIGNSCTLDRPRASGCNGLMLRRAGHPVDPRCSNAVAIRRRGVSSVLAMMFLVIFGSLAAAMAVVAHGNMRTAHSGLQVSRAMSAAETGLVYASLRLQTEASNFIIDKGIIDDGFAERLWMGTYTAADGNIEGPDENTPGIIHAVLNAHNADAHSFNAVQSDTSLPAINEQFGTLEVKPIALSAGEEGTPDPSGPYFRLRYDPVVGEPYIRVTSTGVDGSIKRTLQMDFRITKKIEFAILSVNRVMIGKNVLIEGPLGSRYGIETGELTCANCHPALTRSDFYFLDADLDDLLDVLYASIAEYDQDGDGRLRPNHPAEGPGLSGTGLTDLTGDGYVDDFDAFLSHFDSSSDGMVVYDADLAAAAGLGSLAAEFTADLQLARLIDRANPDRDGDGEIDDIDTLLGYNDGVLDKKDLYAKVRGRLAFAIARNDWESNHEGQSYQAFAVNGAIRPGIDKPAVTFEVEEQDMLEITTDMFNDSHSWFDSQASAPFNMQVAAQGRTYPSTVTEWEGVPYGSPAPYDFYERPVYEDMTFTNVRIPMGLNALFVNCTFVGVTFIETWADCDDVNWNYAGALMEDEENPGTYLPKFDLTAFVSEDIGYVDDTRDWSNNIRFHDCTFLGSVSGVRPIEYTHWRNKIQMTGETRFYLDPDDPDLAADTHPDAAEWKQTLEGLNSAAIIEMSKSSILMPGWSLDVGSFTSDPDADPVDVPRIKLNGIIVTGILDIRGNADVHGTVLMTFRPSPGHGPLAYSPFDCSTCAASFNTTIGYFGPEDGDGEGIAPDHEDFEGFGEILIRYNPDALLPDGIPWPIKVEAVTSSYSEGGI